MSHIGLAGVGLAGIRPALYRAAGPSPAACNEFDAQRWARLQQEWGDDPSESMNSQVRVSSRGRPWNGLAVWLQCGASGDLYVPPMRKHAIVVRRAVQAKLLQYHSGETSERALGQGEVLVIPAGTPSFWRSESERDNLHVNIDPLWLARASGGEDSVPLLKHCFGTHDPVLMQLAQVLLSSLDSNASLNAAFADGIAIALATHLMEHHSAGSAAGSRRTGALSHRQLQVIADAVQDDLHEDWTIERLAALVSLSTFHFARAFKAATGESPHRYLLHKRLEHARQLVLLTRQPLIDIAVDTGFASLSHFGQAFRRRWGSTPGRLRREG